VLLAEGLDFEAFFGAGPGFFLCAFILLDTRYIHTSLGRLCWDSSFENAGTSGEGNEHCHHASKSGCFSFKTCWRIVNEN
jgi:hypothetical protein